MKFAVFETVERNDDVPNGNPGLDIPIALVAF